MIPNCRRQIDARNRLRSRQLAWWRGVDTILQPLLDDAEYSDEAFALLAEFNILNSDLEQAELLLLEHVDANEDWFFVMRMLASKYEFLGNQEAVLMLYRKLLEVKPDSTQDLQQLLSLVRKFGLKEEELHLLESLISNDAQQIRYKLVLIDYYIYYGQFAEAEELLHAGIASGTGYVDFSRRLIGIYKTTNRYAVAIQAAKDVLGQLQEEDHELKIEFMIILGWLYYEDNNTEMAKIVMRWLQELDSDNHSVRFLRARISLDQGRILLAISELRGLTVEDTENPDYDYYLALAHMQRAEFNTAQQSFNMALKKDPSHKQALLKLAEIYLEKGFFEDVQRMINDFLAVVPNDPDALVLQEMVAGKITAFDEAG